MHPPEVTIRSGTQADLPQVLQLVWELAIYERESHAVTATIDDYSRDFTDHWFDLIVAEVNKQIIGVAIFNRAYSTWKGRMIFLEDLIVTEPWRQKGIGSQLFRQLLEEAKSMDARVIKWQVLNWNTPAHAFYAKHQALIETDWWNGKILLTRPTP
ncbi:MAG: GNAT family N-acetyltransferase [Saprospiraceae bacterium]|nr:GNAT family N-acetyltransferase [Saprospiraceae bacterium]